MVLCLDKSPDYSLLASGSKDNTARVWAPSTEGKWQCMAICEGHAESIGAVALSRKSSSPKFLVTASQDRTLKLWDLTSATPGTTSKPKSLGTIRAHEKDINSLDISPNDRFLASGSQDKLVKIYAIDFDENKAGATGALKPLGTCKGHRRGVWTVRFSKTDRVVASGAADRTVKLWSLDDYTCLKVSRRFDQTDIRRLRGIPTLYCGSTFSRPACNSSLRHRTDWSSCGTSGTSLASRPWTTTRTR